MALTLYQTNLNLLLHNQSGTLYATSDLTNYINRARHQVALEGACIRGLLSFSTGGAIRSYPFSGFTIPSGNGWQSVVAVRQLYGTVPIASRTWEWYAQFYLLSNATAPTITTWAQYFPGVSGTLYVFPVPSATQTLQADCVLLPIDLVDDTTIEALPYPWTDAAIYYAAYLAFSGVSRNADADRMFSLYIRHMTRARDSSVPSQLPRNYPFSGQLSGVPTNTAVLNATGAATGTQGGNNGA